MSVRAIERGIRLRFANETVRVGGAEEKKDDEVVLDGPVALVVERTEAFRRAYPRVPILYRRGPFALIAADHVPEPAQGDGYRVRRVDSDELILGCPEPDPGVECDERCEKIKELLGHIAPDTYLDDLSKIAGFSRVSDEPGFGEAMGWVEGRLRALGWTVETRMDVDFEDGEETRVTQNAIAKFSALPDEKPPPLFIVCAHLDALGSSPGAAWGADDNASGCAALLAIARFFAGRELKHELHLLLFGGEEQGRHGSLEYVRQREDELGRRRAIVINLDMIGHRLGSEIGALLHSRPLTGDLVAGVLRARDIYAPRFAICTSDKGLLSDHRSFLSEGIRAVMLAEPGLGNCDPDNGCNSVIHTSADTPDRIDREQPVAITRLVAAYLAERLL